MTPQSRIKVSTAAFSYAVDLMSDLLGNGRRLLGAEPGATFIEKVAGHTLIAKRLRCGGVDVREPGIGRADDYDPAANGLGCYDLAIAAQRAEVEAGRKLTPAEMLAAVDGRPA